ncbi:GNAT family N-acetyltransferase [Kitasatospora acidiphila]|uniref:GNAT family N-acetyltransferase n=1 Tax=Kitasatospora acidiphila TaxID=2567942 RepID=UPI002B40019E|nr:hypothetical protein [Kitasatospora acidiphila]
MPAPVTLTGRTVRLEPLTEQHAEGLAAAAAEDRSTFGFTAVPQGLDGALEFIAAARADLAAGRSLAFATVRASDGLVVGSTRFLELDYWQGRWSGRRCRPARSATRPPPCRMPPRSAAPGSPGTPRAPGSTPRPSC